MFLADQCFECAENVLLGLGFHHQRELCYFFALFRARYVFFHVNAVIGGCEPDHLVFLVKFLAAKMVAAHRVLANNLVLIDF